MVYLYDDLVCVMGFIDIFGFFGWVVFVGIVFVIFLLLLVWLIELFVGCVWYWWEYCVIVG